MGREEKMENCEISAVNRLKNATVVHCLEYRRKGGREKVGGNADSVSMTFSCRGIHRIGQNDESTIAMSQHMPFDMCVQNLDACAKEQSLHCSMGFMICPFCHLLQMFLSGCILK